MTDRKQHHLKGVTGPDHPRWGAELDKAGSDRRLTRQRGRASDHQCIHCHRRAMHWVLVRITDGHRAPAPSHQWSLNAEDYDPMCRAHRNALSPNLEVQRSLGIIKPTV